MEEKIKPDESKSNNPSDGKLGRKGKIILTAIVAVVLLFNIGVYGYLKCYKYIGTGECPFRAEKEQSTDVKNTSAD